MNTRTKLGRKPSEDGDINDDSAYYIMLRVRYVEKHNFTLDIFPLTA